jgi:NADPH:quinone reductase-like Zn-dependent oxidoreductase
LAPPLKHLLTRQALGAGTVVTAASGADNIALVKSLGADVVIDYKVENIFDALQNNSIDVV